MGLALALSLSLITQQAPTMVYQVSGPVQKFQLYWTFDPSELILGLDGVSVNSINDNPPSAPISIKFASAQLQPIPSNPNLCSLSDQNGDAIISYQWTSVGYGSGAVELGFETGFALEDQMSPFTFVGFDYGAFVLVTLVPSSGRVQDIQDVMNGKSLTVSGTANFELVLAPYNTLVYPRPNLRVFIPAVRY